MGVSELLQELWHFLEGKLHHLRNELEFVLHCINFVSFETAFFFAGEICCPFHLAGLNLWKPSPQAQVGHLSLVSCMFTVNTVT